MQASRSRVAAAQALAVVAVWMVFVVSTPAQESTPYTTEEQVTAVDVLIDAEADQRDGKGTSNLPRNLQPKDFSVRVDGELRPVVGLFDPRLGIDAERPEQWTLVLYFDLGSAQSSSVRWAAGLLAEQAEHLSELGEVEIVVADPSPVRRLAPTRDTGMLQRTLSGVALEPIGRHEVLEARSLFLESPDRQSDAAWADLAQGLIGEERGFVGRRLDDLLTFLVDRSSPSPGKAVFVVSDGFDLEPSRFYGLLTRTQRSMGFEVTADLTNRAELTANVLAGYGWIVVPLFAPERGPGLVPGLRIGKWRFLGVRPSGPVVGTVLGREDQRDPEKAEAFLEVGESHLEAGDPEAAQQAFEEALIHFAGDPRTAERQAAAKAGLGRALEAQGLAEAARQAFDDAAALDEKYAAEYPGTQAFLVDPLVPLELLADATVGRVVGDEEGLAMVMESLGRRLRLTYQVSGWPQGLSRRLDVQFSDRQLRPRLARWARSGTPDEVAAARARRLLTGDSIEGDLPLVLDVISASAESSEVGVVIEIDLTTKPSGWRDDRPHQIRVTVAKGGLQASEVTHQRSVEQVDSQESLWTLDTRVAGLGEEDWIAVVVEDLESGLWGAGMIEPR